MYNDSPFAYSIVCNEVPEDPVLSPISKHVFERRLIVKFIQQNGSDPINGEPLTEDDLLEIKGSFRWSHKVCSYLMHTILFQPTP